MMADPRGPRVQGQLPLAAGRRPPRGRGRSGRCRARSRISSRARGLTLTAILATHHHADHVGGVAGARVRTGNARSSARPTTRWPASDRAPGAKATAFEVPGLDCSFDGARRPGPHRGPHRLLSGPRRAVFCGDTLFAVRLRAPVRGHARADARHRSPSSPRLPDDTRVYCAHEYTAGQHPLRRARSSPATRRSPSARSAKRPSARAASPPCPRPSATSSRPIRSCAATRPEVDRGRRAARGPQAARIPVEVFAADARMEKQFLIRAADRPRTRAELLRLIRELAGYEKLAAHGVGTAAMLQRRALRRAPGVRGLDGRARRPRRGLRPLLHRPSPRSSASPASTSRTSSSSPGIAARASARRCSSASRRSRVERGCGRFEWRVLDWNEPSIRFYESLGAAVMKEWLLVRLTGQPLEQLAAR